MGAAPGTGRDLAGRHFVVNELSARGRRGWIRIAQGRGTLHVLRAGNVDLAQKHGALVGQVNGGLKQGNKSSG